MLQLMKQHRISNKGMGVNLLTLLTRVYILLCHNIETIMDHYPHGGMNLHSNPRTARMTDNEPKVSAQ